MSEAILKNIERAIKDIHNIGIMLSGASEYVCEEGVLKRFSRYLQAYHKRLESDITSLKKEYPGKFPETPELDGSLSKITDISAALEQEKKAVETKCRAGSFGHELNTQVAELKDGRIDRYRIAPADFGLTAGATDALVVQTAEQSLALIDQVFTGQPGPARDIVVLNAGAAVYAAGLSETLAAGVKRAAEVIDAGRAREKFAALIEFTRQV